jgi:O-antigen/teichoic acid export membrane protein
VRQSHLILSNAIVIWTARILQLVPQLILVPFLIHRIGDSGYGMYAMIWSLIAAVDQLQRSLQSGVVKYSAAFLAQKRIDEVNKIISSSFVFSILLAILACTGIISVTIFYKHPSGNLIVAILVVGATTLLTIPLTPYVAVIQSLQRYYVDATTETIFRYLSLLTLSIWFRLSGPSLQAPIIVMAAALLLSRFAQVPIAYHFIPGLQNRLSLFNMASFRMITCFGITIVVASLCLAINTTGIRWLIGTLVSPSIVTHLAIILMPGLLLAQVVEAVTVTVMPATSAYEATGNKPMLQELLICGMRYTTVLIFMGIIAAGLMMQNVLRIWVGQKYVFLSPYAIASFVSLSFMLSTSIGHHMLKGLGKLKAIIFIYLIGLVLVPISLFLLLYRVGNDHYFAIVVGLSAGNIVCGCLQIGYCSKAVNLGLNKLLERVYYRPMFIISVTMIPIWGFLHMCEINTIIGRLIISFIASLVFAVLSYLFIVTSDEKIQIRSAIYAIANKITMVRQICYKRIYLNINE